MKTLNNTNNYYKPKQLKLQLEIEKIIEISDPVYSFCEIVDCIDFNSYFAKKGCKTGRPRYNRTNLLKVILFSFMENGYLSLRGIEKSCKTDIRYMWILILNIDESTFVHGKGCRKSTYQRKYETLKEYKEKLIGYAKHIEICGKKRGSYSKTDNSATFMRVKRDYMGNDQLLPEYNMQVAVCDEYIATVDVKQYASDMDCFVPLMEKFNEQYGRYPLYPVADAGYGSYNNYLYCEEHGMEKFMKFTMFEKETKDQKYRDNPYRAVNFSQDENGRLICPNGRKFKFKYEKHVKGNNYGRTEEIYECENCENCKYKKDCCPKAKNNRTIRLNRELTSIHEEVLRNLCSIQGALLCMNRSIQAEGTYGILKWNKSYKRLCRKGLESVILEFTLISCGFNLYKYHNKINRIKKCA